MAQLFSNNAQSVLVAGITNIGLTLQVSAGHGAKFPNPTGGDYFLATLSKVAGGIESSVEIVRVTARATDVFTIVRAQEGTTALVYAENDIVSLRATAASMTSMEDHKANVSNPHTVTKTQVGLGSVDNTADTAKPVSTAQQTALNLKANIASPTFTGTVGGITAAMVGAPSGSGTSSGTNTGDQTITLTGEVTGSGTGSFAATVTNAAVIGKVLTGYVSGAGTVAATDTILQAVNKLNGNVALKGVGDVVSGGALGTPSSGTLTNCTADGTNAVGFRHIPQVSQSAAYTLVLTDAGKHILHPSADTTARIFTIPANASVAFPIGTAVTFVNQNAGGVITIAITTDTMRLAGAGTTGSRTLAANGVATAIKLTSTEWIISGGSSLT